MDSPGNIYDEVIADSEGEMAEEEDSVRGELVLILLIMTANSKNIVNTVSQVSTFTSTGRLQATSSISAFTAGPPAFWKQDSTTNNMNNQLDQISDVGNFMGTASIADRAKTRQRNTKQSSSAKPNASSNGQLERHKSNANLSSDVIELTSDEDDDELGLRASRPRSRPKPKLKMKDKTRDMNLDKNTDASGATEITADKSSDAIPDPRPRPRPRPRPLVKRSKTAHESAVPPLLPLDIPGFPPSSASASHGPELPIATSPVQSHLPTSQLPPSDSPLPTLITMHDEGDLPRIETLPNLDFDGPLSSPSSLFSDIGDSTKKRKRTVLDLDIDELVSDGGPASGQEGIRAGARYNYDNDEAAHVPSHTLPPPPTFFAGSSSSSTGGGNGRIPSPELGRDVVDLTMLPPTIEPSGAATKKAAKVNKSRQKKSNTIIDEDDLDDDFDPMESTKKGKSRPKVKKSTDTKAKPNKGQRQVEVSIVSKPRTKKTKGKAKEKATAGNKDTFKSREFIDNSGDEDPIQLIPNAKDPATSTDSHRISTNKSGSHMSTSAALRTADTSSIGTTSTPLSKTLLEGNTLVSPGDKSDSGNAIMSSSSNRMNKKRKSIIESDPEDEDEGEKDPAVGASPKKHKDKRGKYSRKIDDATKDDDDPYMEEHEDIQKEQPPPVPKVSG